MKTKRRTNSPETTRHPSAAIISSALIALVLWGPISPLQAERDAIGSLPQKAQSTLSIDPTIVVEGEAASVLAVIGRGLSADVTLLGNTARATFSGVGLLAIDRSSVVNGKLNVYLDAGPNYAGGLSALVVEGRRMGAQLLPAGLLDLGLKRLERSGLLDEAILDRHNFSSTREHQLMRTSASGSWIRIEIQG